ncbi:MAG TPA: DegT/DnrJ/EryC1/StrS family aminotransferase, partial [Candidatus Nitrosotenuis sp.]|nr:DegT/DnrJ/EryC1/StrS family aminotransferase [Candidatus Nitrosotenuis sp.]
ILDDRIEQKQKIYHYYQNHLTAIPAIKLMPIAENRKPNYWLTTVVIDPESGVCPEMVRQALAQEHIEARPLWKPMHCQPVFAQAKVFGGQVSETLFQTGLCLPSGSNLRPCDQDRIIGIIKQVMEKR